MRRRWLRATAFAAAGFAGLFGAVAALAPQPRLVWNASASVPLGLYRIDVGATPRLGDLVLVEPPAPLAALLAGRGYLPRGVPLLKHVAAAEGALVCRSGVFVTVDGRFGARARAADRLGRALPRWLGCRRLARGEYLLLGSAPDSFDGRYFGALRAESLIGTAHPLLTRDAPGAPLRWRRGDPTHAFNPQAKEPTI
ncbi:S26 family signal peptidase [Sphingopyxis sp. JAI108]|uniref:S26 family signal peptidase n=1 Tax=Sphingopyxis sp. JAI108 TaxID=2723060 RepID=UPI0015CA8D1D|nr:conjugative transfer signal peptidase TraF [Sphingopyxis sp. JAI108]